MQSNFTGLNKLQEIKQTLYDEKASRQAKITDFIKKKK